MVVVTIKLQTGTNNDDAFLREMFCANGGITNTKLDDARVWIQMTGAMRNGVMDRSVFRVALFMLLNDG